MPTAPRPIPRLLFLDWLRILALLLLVRYHVGMYYVSWPWHVKSAFAGPALEPWMRLSSPWRMSLLFLVSGAALSLALRRWPAGTPWLRQRARRLGLPLLAGVLLWVPLQPYFEVVQFHGYTGGYLDFMRLYLGAHGGFCAPGRGCLILPTWNHLWYLPYLLLYTALLAGQLRWCPGLLDSQAQRLAPRLGATWAPAVPLAWLLATLALLRPLFAPSHALVDDLYLHSQYAALFLLGAVLARTPGAWARAEALRWPALGLALLGWGLMQALPGPLWRGLGYSLAQWCGVLAALGFDHRHLQHDGPWRRRLSNAVFPVYGHQDYRRQGHERQDKAGRQPRCPGLAPGCRSAAQQQVGPGRVLPQEYEGTSHFRATASKRQDWWCESSICSPIKKGKPVDKITRGVVARVGVDAYFSPSWTAFQADGGRDFSVIVDGVSN